MNRLSVKGILMLLCESIKIVIDQINQILLGCGPETPIFNPYGIEIAALDHQIGAWIPDDELGVDFNVPPL
jgi:hypothetical protein